jgi:hypothetical protein
MDDYTCPDCKEPLRVVVGTDCPRSIYLTPMVCPTCMVLWGRRFGGGLILVSRPEAPAQGVNEAEVGDNKVSQADSSAIAEWQTDPFGRFESRRFFLGAPTSLVRNGETETVDPISQLLTCTEDPSEQRSFSAMPPEGPFNAEAIDLDDGALLPATKDDACSEVGHSVWDFDTTFTASAVSPWGVTLGLPPPPPAQPGARYRFPRLGARQWEGLAVILATALTVVTVSITTHHQAGPHPSATSKTRATGVPVSPETNLPTASHATPTTPTTTSMPTTTTTPRTTKAATRKAATRKSATRKSATTEPATTEPTTTEPTTTEPTTTEPTTEPTTTEPTTEPTTTAPTTTEPTTTEPTTTTTTT